MALRFTIAVDDKGNPVIKQLGGNVSNLDKKMDSLAKKAQQVGTAFVAYFAADKIISFGKSAVAAYDTQVQALKKLEISLGYTSMALINQASSLQSVTTFGDEATIAMQANLAMFQLNEEEILKLTPAILDMAQATGTDLVSAAQKVAKSITTKTNALQRDGIEVDVSASKTEKLEQVLGKLEERYAGQARAAASVGSGGLKQLTNLFGDLQENIGKLIVDTPIFQATLKGLTWITNKLITATSDLNGQYEISIEDMKDAEGGALDLSAAIKQLIPDTAAYGVVLSEINKGFDASPEAINEMMGKIKTVTAEAEATLVNFSNKQRSIEGKNHAIAKKKSALAEAEAAAKRRAAEEAAKLAELNGGGKTSQLSDDDFLQGVSDELAKEEKDKLDKMLQNIENNLSARISLEQGYDIALKTWKAEQTATELDDLAVAYEDKLTLAEMAGADHTALDQKYALEREAIVAKELQMAKIAQIQKMQMTANMIGSFAGLNAALKGNAKATQLLLASETVMNTSAGIAAHFKDPFPINVLQGAAIAASGITQLANIKSQKFADGGWVAGNGNPRSDNIPALLSPGERVVSVAETRRAGGRDAVDRAVYAGNRNSGGVTVNVSGSIVAPREWLRDELIPAIDRERSR